jgi:hypothetical protein
LNASLTPGGWARVVEPVDAAMHGGRVRRLYPPRAVRVELVRGEWATVAYCIRPTALAKLPLSVLQPVPAAEPCCPKCGGVNGYSVADRVVGSDTKYDSSGTGWVERTGSWGGMEKPGDGGFRVRRSETVACRDCERRVPRPPKPEPETQTVIL